MSNAEFSKLIHLLAQLVASLTERVVFVVLSFEATRVCQFIRLSHSVFIGSKLVEDPNNFIDMEKTFQVIHASEVKGVEFSPYQLKDVAYKWYEEWEQSKGDDVESAL